MAYHRILNIVPCAIQSDLVIYTIFTLCVIVIRGRQGKKHEFGALSISAESGISD